MSWSGPLLQQQFIFTASWINEKLHESQGHAEPWTSQRVLEPQSWIRPTQTWRAAKAFPGQCPGTPAKLSGGQEVRFYQSVVASIRWVWSRSSRGWLSCRRRRSLFACLGTRGSRLGRNSRSWLLTLFAGHSLLGLKLLLHHRFVLSFLNPFSELFHFSLIQAPMRKCSESQKLLRSLQWPATRTVSVKHFLFLQKHFGPTVANNGHGCHRGNRHAAGGTGYDVQQWW